MGPSGMNALGAMLREAGQGVFAYHDLARQRRLDEQKDRQARLDEERAEQQMEAARQQMMTEELQQEALRHAIEMRPKNEAMADFRSGVDVMGVEGALNSPEMVAKAEAGGITFPRQPMLPKDLTFGGVSTPVGEFTGEDLTGAYRKREAKLAFPNTGVAKPPQVQEKEAERELAMERANQIMGLFKGLSNGSAQGIASTPEEVKRLKLKIGLGIDPTSVYGPIRQTPEESAAVAAADAEARLPFQKELVKFAAEQRGADLGDPYFNQALTAIMSLMPPVTPEMADKVVELALTMAQGAQSKVPRGAPDARVPQPPPQTPDSLIDQGFKAFGSYDKLLEMSNTPQVQQKLKSAGIDPAAYIRRIQARKILENLNKLQAPK